MPSQCLVNGKLKDYYQVITKIGGSKNIFGNDQDYETFLRYLGYFVLIDDSIGIAAYCLSSNHFNLLLAQYDDGGIDKFIHMITTDYNEYYYNKYGVEDLLSESNYNITKVSEDDILNVSHNIHTQNEGWLDCQNSSIRAFLYDDTPSWLDKRHLVDKCKKAVDYLQLLDAYVTA